MLAEIKLNIQLNQENLTIRISIFKERLPSRQQDLKHAQFKYAQFKHAQLKHAQRIAQTAHNEANRKLRAGEAQLQKHLCVATEVMQKQVRMLREPLDLVAKHFCVNWARRGTNNQNENQHPDCQVFWNFDTGTGCILLLEFIFST